MDTELQLELAPLGLLAGGVLAAAIVVGRRRLVRSTSGADRGGREFQVLPPPDHDRPAAAMLTELARTSALSSPGPVLIGASRPAAFGRAVRISARRIFHRDYANGAWTRSHAARLEHLYPGIQVKPSKEEPC